MDLLEGLLRLICLPYTLWKGSIESSRLGASEEDLRTLRFWKWVAVAGIAAFLLAGLAIALLAWKILF